MTATLVASLGNLLKDERYSDVTIRVFDVDSTEYKDIKAHKAILAGRSPYFESLFSSGLKETQTNIIELKGNKNPDCIGDFNTYGDIQIVLEILIRCSTDLLLKMEVVLPIASIAIESAIQSPCKSIAISYNLDELTVLTKSLDTSFDLVSKLVTYLYTAHTDIDDFDTGIDLYLMADKFMCNDFKEFCADKCVALITPVNVMLIARNCYLVAPAIFRYCLTYLIKLGLGDITEAFKSSEVLDMPAEVLKEILDQPMKIQELTLFLKLVEWGTRRVKQEENMIYDTNQDSDLAETAPKKQRTEVAPEALKSKLQELLPLIRFSDITPEDIYHTVDPLQLVDLSTRYNAIKWQQAPKLFDSTCQEVYGPRRRFIIRKVPVEEQRSQHDRYWVIETTNCECLVDYRGDCIAVDLRKRGYCTNETYRCKMSVTLLSHRHPWNHLVLCKAVLHSGSMCKVPVPTSVDRSLLIQDNQWTVLVEFANLFEDTNKK